MQQLKPFLLFEVPLTSVRLEYKFSGSGRWMEEGGEDERVSSWHFWRESLWLHCAIAAWLVQSWTNWHKAVSIQQFSCTDPLSVSMPWAVDSFTKCMNPRDNFEQQLYIIFLTISFFSLEKMNLVRAAKKCFGKPLEDKANWNRLSLRRFLQNWRPWIFPVRSFRISRPIQLWDFNATRKDGAELFSAKRFWLECSACAGSMQFSLAKPCL